MNEQHDLDGLGALITGATSGIGAAVAEALARHGANVVVHGRDRSRGQTVVDHITAGGGSARFAAADLTDPDQLTALTRDAGTVDILVNNAGTAWFGPTPDLDVAGFDRLFAAHVRAAYFLVAALAPQMIARGGGSIINIGSRAGPIGMPTGAAYNAAKASLASFTRSWAAEFGPAGVRVNTVSAGPVYTTSKPATETAAANATTLMARAAQPAELADLIAFLASPEAAHVTGAVFAADGSAPPRRPRYRISMARPMDASCVPLQPPVDHETP